METPCNHEVNDEPKISVEPYYDALANASQLANGPPVNARERRVRRAKEKASAFEAHALERPTDDARFQRPEVGGYVGKLGHIRRADARLGSAIAGNRFGMNDIATRPFAIVTGGSDGIGRSLAGQFVQHGYDVLIAAEDAGVNDAARDLSSADGTVEAIVVDLSTADGVDRLAERITSGGRPIDAIAINAGIGVGGAFTETSLEQELESIDLNVRSTVHLTKRILPSMVERGQGKILFTSSVASLMATPYEAVYGATKAFVKSFAAAIRNEVAETGVTVTTLMPGPTETNFFKRAGMMDTKVGADPKKADAEDVARQGFEALMSGKDQIIAGTLKTKLEGSVATLLPEKVTAGQHGAAAKPGSAPGSN